MNRHTARKTAFKMVFQIEVGQNPREIALHTLNAAGLGSSLSQFALSLVDGVVNNRDELDRLIGGFTADWSVERLANVDKNILRLALYEMNHTEGVPPAVIINEAIELAKEYGGEDSGGFVNAVLDNYLTNLNQSGGR